MGIGPQGLGSMGMSKNSRPCGSPLNKNGKTKRSAPMDLKTMEARKTRERGEVTSEGKRDKNFSLLDINGSPLTKKDTCWDGYKAQGQKKSPSGKKTASGKAKMVNNCVKV
jgi:hypothetical protein